MVRAKSLSWLFSLADFFNQLQNSRIPLVAADANSVGMVRAQEDFGENDVNLSYIGAVRRQHFVFLAPDLLLPHPLVCDDADSDILPFHLHASYINGFVRTLLSNRLH